MSTTHLKLKKLSVLIYRSYFPAVITIISKLFSHEKNLPLLETNKKWHNWCKMKKIAKNALGQFVQNEKICNLLSHRKRGKWLMSACNLCTYAKYYWLSQIKKKSECSHLKLTKKVSFEVSTLASTQLMVWVFLVLFFSTYFTVKKFKIRSTAKSRLVSTSTRK